MLCKVTHCTGCVFANTRPHQLGQSYQEMGTAILCRELSQVVGLIRKISRRFWKVLSLNLYCLSFHMLTLRHKYKYCAS